MRPSRRSSTTTSSKSSAGMASFKIRLNPDAEADFRRIPFPLRRAINERIQKLKSDPRPPEAQAFSQGEKYRLAVHGWTVLYGIDDDTSTVTLHAFQREAS